MHISICERTHNAEARALSVEPPFKTAHIGQHARHNPLQSGLQSQCALEREEKPGSDQHHIYPGPLMRFLPVLAESQ